MGTKCRPRPSRRMWFLLMGLWVFMVNVLGLGQPHAGQRPFWRGRGDITEAGHWPPACTRQAWAQSRLRENASSMKGAGQRAEKAARKGRCHASPVNSETSEKQSTSLVPFCLALQPLTGCLKVTNCVEWSGGKPASAPSQELQAAYQEKLLFSSPPSPFASFSSFLNSRTFYLKWNSLLSCALPFI